MSYIILRGRWCDIIILNVYAPTKDKIDDMKGRFYEELERVFDKCSKYRMKIVLGDFNAKVGRGNIFKPTIYNDNGIKSRRIVNLVHHYHLNSSAILHPSTSAPIRCLIKHCLSLTMF
jgi:exonuclease III